MALRCHITQPLFLGRVTQKPLKKPLLPNKVSYTARPWHSAAMFNHKARQSVLASVSSGYPRATIYQYTKHVSYHSKPQFLHLYSGNDTKVKTS